MIGCRVGSMQTSLHTGEPATNSVADLIVSDGREAPLRAREGMLHGKMGSTGTASWNIGGKPSIPQGQGVLEGTLVQ